MNHSLIGASSMHRWSKCPGSVRLIGNNTQAIQESGIERRSAADEGTKAHDYASRILNHWDTRKTLNITDDIMWEAVDKYVDLITKDCINATITFCEKSIDLSHLYPGLKGTADYIAYWKDSKLLSVYDFKYGSGHRIKAKGNLQLLYYLLGAYEELKKKHEILRIEAVIVQPRMPLKSGKFVDRYRPKLSSLEVFKKRLIWTARRTQKPNAELVMGEWCFYCPARLICPLQKQNKLDKVVDFFNQTNNHGEVN